MNIYILFFISHIIIMFLLFLIYKKLTQKKDGIYEDYDINFDDDMDEYEVERIQREKDFDDRIEKLKHELASRVEINPLLPTSRPADELHPQVFNLPHDTINKNYNNFPDVEYID